MGCPICMALFTSVLWLSLRTGARSVAWWIPVAPDEPNWLILRICQVLPRCLSFYGKGNILFCQKHWNLWWAYDTDVNVRWNSMRRLISSRNTKACTSLLISLYKLRKRGTACGKVSGRRPDCVRCALGAVVFHYIPLLPFTICHWVHATCFMTLPSLPTIIVPPYVSCTVLLYVIKPINED